MDSINDSSSKPRRMLITKDEAKAVYALGQQAFKDGDYGGGLVWIV